MSLLEIKNLSVEIDTLRGKIKPVDRVSFSIDESQTFGLVGESGCGKSLTSLALMGLLPKQAVITSDHILFNGTNLNSLSTKQHQKIRGSEISMIFQNPMTCLNPSFTVGFQLNETLKIHRSLDKKEREQESIRLLERVGIRDAKNRLHSFPHELSGGMCQRVMIAIAICSEPKLLIADEPTTALDVTIQAQILDLLRELQDEHKMALLLITHDLAVVSQMASHLAVMYAGQIVEQGTTRELIQTPNHPYTAGLLDCLPKYSDENYKKPLSTIAGLVPDLVNRPSGCQLNPRCTYAQTSCTESEPINEWNKNRFIKCHYPLRESV